ncbi:MAG: TetR/AcrR family transcriptional regulator [Ilumatobacteraceae bacterium]
MNRPTPKQARSRATVEKILAAANIEFASRGSAVVTTTDIADRAGVSVGALYRFFPDKQAIGAALAERYLHAAAERFGPLLDAIGDLQELPEGLRPVVRAAADLATEHPGYYQLTREVAPGDEASAGQAVRSAMIDEFDALIGGLGAPDDPRRRPAITLVIETVRHTLATAPTDEIERSIVVDELAEMIVTYAHRRLSFTPGHEVDGDQA